MSLTGVIKSVDPAATLLDPLTRAESPVCSREPLTSAPDIDLMAHQLCDQDGDKHRRAYPLNPISS